ncbi:MAG: hypothetical protein ACI85O_001355 [Saprospiraceae bacterium]
MQGILASAKKLCKISSQNFTMLKRIPFLFSILFLVGQLSAQDTITVQTITRDNDARSGTYTFPTGEQSYEKILMIYNMRCKDDIVNQTGGNDVGCGEWDYSCNTFITDPTRTDSTAVSHPTHIISGFSGDEFSYTSQPSYTYYQYEQHDVNYSEILSEATSTVGNGEEELLLAVEQTVGRAQFLYTADEIIAGGLSAGNMTGLKLDMSTIGATVPFMRISLKATDKTELSANDPDLTGFTEVYFLNTNFDATGLHDFNFYQDFAWDGASNVIVEFTFTGSAGDNGIKGDITPTVSALFNGTEDNSIAFNGAGTIVVPAESLQSIENEVTISFWSKGNEAILPVNNSVFEGANDANVRGVNVHLPWSNGQIYWDCGNVGGGYDRINKVAPVEAFAGSWSHWTFTKNATTGSMKIYLNGEEWHSGTGMTRPISLTSFNIGSAITFNNNYYGNVDEFQIWDKALDAATIQEYMRQPITDAHPDYANLVAYYPMNEGVGFEVEDYSSNSNTAQITGGPAWSSLRGKDLFKNFAGVNLRANAVFVQGTYTTVDDTPIVLQDSILNGQHVITEYDVEGTDLVELGQTFVYPSGDMNIIDEAGNIVGTVAVADEGSITIGSLVYYLKRDAKFEILSLVTPYGIGLDLGSDGKTFVFDVTDYAPILQGDRLMTMELGGQRQEEMDIKFQFITGTPPREIMNLQNIWPFARGWYTPIQEDAIFEPRELNLASDGSHFKLRSSITGHGQNGEFVPREHYLNINGGEQDFTYQVWKTCGENPIYPQGGTWIYDRAGWCPGEATDVNEFDITDMVTPGGTAMVDYGVNGSALTAANYLVSNQLVTYGENSFQTDAAITEIISPSKRVEFERLNPICNSPTVVIRNTGAEVLTSLKIDYTTLGNSVTESYTWTGSLASMASEEVVLPISSQNVFSTSEEEHIFEVTVSEPNGVADEYAQNNVMHSEFELPRLFEDLDVDFLVYVRTNNQPQETSYTVKDASGNIIISRDNLSANTVYKDDLDFPPGCYSLEILDSDGDGLSFWADPNAGNGNASIRRYLGSSTLSAKTFEPEFGSIIKFDFVIGTITPTDDVDDTFRFFSIAPNPTVGEAKIELQGFTGDFNIELVSLTGQILNNETLRLYENEYRIHTISLDDFPVGMYFVRIVGEDKVWTKAVVKE